MEQVAQFRSIEAVEPTTLTIYRDRVVLASGVAVTRIVRLGDLVRVKIRTLLGISTVLLKTADGSTVVADLFLPAEARTAKDVLDGLLAGEPAADRAGDRGDAVA